MIRCLLIQLKLHSLWLPTHFPINWSNPSPRITPSYDSFCNEEFTGQRNHKYSFPDKNHFENRKKLYKVFNQSQPCLSVQLCEFKLLFLGLLDPFCLPPPPPLQLSELIFFTPTGAHAILDLFCFAPPPQLSEHKSFMTPRTCHFLT